MDNKIILFQEKQVRREWHNEEWSFSVEPKLGSTENDCHLRKNEVRKDRKVTLR